MRCKDMKDFRYHVQKADWAAAIGYIKESEVDRTLALEVSRVGFLFPSSLQFNKDKLIKKIIGQIKSRDLSVTKMSYDAYRDKVNHEVKQQLASYNSNWIDALMQKNQFKLDHGWCFGYKPEKTADKIVDTIVN